MVAPELPDGYRLGSKILPERKGPVEPSRPCCSRALTRRRSRRPGVSPRGDLPRRGRRRLGRSGGVSAVHSFGERLRGVRGRSLPNGVCKGRPESAGSRGSLALRDELRSRRCHWARRSLGVARGGGGARGGSLRGSQANPHDPRRRARLLLPALTPLGSRRLVGALHGQEPRRHHPRLRHEEQANSGAPAGTEPVDCGRFSAARHISFPVLRFRPRASRHERSVRCREEAAGSCAATASGGLGRRHAGSNRNLRGSRARDGPAGRHAPSLRGGAGWDGARRAWG